ncbi:adhesion G protein-coupled receptor E5 isoform X2 [Hemibagrus wyckioides]|uniref:adhesion G protein-coupled receptor E5 isoform X2 n=1 Tax=Hemibagrus wyckioides TaxID=337641 RepID=UPI00266DA956|nr:adhesion G protein-coupled receptor E5 isoform X2 [Hemibagrus wyckioides]
MRCLLFLGLLLVILTNMTASSYCPLGYEQGPIICKDEDECVDKENRCGNNTVCYNTIGSFYCQCEPGYRPEFVHFTAAEGGLCEDIDECEGNQSICGLNAVCSNKIGSYICTCASGFVASTGQTHFNASQNVRCNDIDECEGNQSICGFKAVCSNKIGSYICTCASGSVASTGQTHFNASQNVRCNELQCDRLGHLSVQIPTQLQQVLDELKSACVQNGASGEEMLQILIEALESFLSKTSLTNTKLITAVFELVEKTLSLVGQLMLKSRFSQLSSQTGVEMLVHRKPTAPRGPYNLSTNEVQFHSDWETAVGDSYLGYASAALFEYTDVNISQVKSFINNSFHEPNSSANAFELNSRVVTIEVTNPNTAHLKKPVTLRFSHLQEAVRKVACVFWDSSTGGGVWSNKGCDVVEYSTSYTVCSCKHLSSFAVLMSLYEQEDVFELQLITWIGLALSLICLLICILTFWLIRSIQSTRTTIHLHLCISLFIADLIFLAGISQTEYKVGCAVVAGLLHYFFLAVFCWMCLEGVQLFRMVVLVFNTTLSHGYLMAAGYGVPALIVVISASVNYKGYGTPRYCWLSLEDGFIWSFFGPVCVIIVVNAVFFLITVWKLAEKFNSLNPDLNNLTKIKTFTITAIAQLCILGTMWIFGCFQFDERMLVMSYLFTILNSLQGVLVFIMHCLLSKQVRDEYIRFLTCLTTRQKSSYSEFSTNQSSKSQVSKSIHNTGESRI